MKRINVLICKIGTWTSVGHRENFADAGKLADEWVEAGYIVAIRAENEPSPQ